MRKLTSYVAVALFSTMLLSAATAAPGDYLCKAQLFGERAQLWLKNDKPVQYQWHNRPVLSAQIRGSTITINAKPKATISNVQIGKTSKGQKVVKGDFKFKKNEQAGLTFVCAAK